MDSISSKFRPIPYLIIIAVVAILECLVGNFSAFNTSLCKPVELVNNVTTDEMGIYETEFISINQNVKNLFVDLKLTDSDKASVIISITDEGDKYPYELPETIVVPGVQSTYYTNLYAFGDIKTIKVKVQIPEWAKADIISIKVNQPQPFSFKWIRFIILTVISCLFYAFRRESGLYNIYCEKGNKKQILVMCVTVFLVVMVALILVRSNPRCVASPWTHQHQYQELAYVLEDGNVELLLKPDEGLLNAENPYDTIALGIEGIPFHMDHAFYKGKYYVYFGIVPEVLFYLPYYLLTGQDLSNYHVMFVLYSMFCVGIFGLLWELIQRYQKKIPFFQFLILSISVCSSTNFLFLIARPDLYNIPIIAANCFVTLGLFLWLKGLAAERCKFLWYAFGSLCMALVAGCRPQMLLFSLIGIVLFYKEIRKKNWKELVALCIPYFLVGALVFWYNAARFGSGFDFGATYSLTSNDMNHRGFNFARVFHGLFAFFIQPATFKSTFPFIYSANLDNAYMGKNMTEFTFGGVFASNFLLLIIFYWIFVRRQRFKGEQKILAILLCGISFVIAAFDVNGAGILQRYISDMVLGFNLCAVLMWITTLDQSKESSNYYIWARIVQFLVLCSFVYGFLVVFAKGDSVCLQNDNPALFYRVASYFKF